VEGVPEFWTMVADAGERHLVLDYDGTLAPFRVNRMDARPLDGVREYLEQIRDSGSTKMAMLTGRPLEELLVLIGDLGVPMVGSHGFEFLLADGTIERGRLTSEQESRFQRAEKEARTIGENARVERKPASIGLHTRGMPESEAERLHSMVASAWEDDTATLGLECRRFSGGVELRLRSVNKGTALARLLEGRSPDALCVYVGDDDTDEDAFGALPDKGVGIRVGPPGVRSLAKGRLDDPAAVRGFLRSWIATTVR
jgi:trehalose 6-phosphate phosphatase